MKTVAIIGNARDIPPPCNGALFDKMCEEALRIITDDFGLDSEDVCLVSGAAAWGDHVAIRLWLSRGGGYFWRTAVDVDV